MTGGKRLDFKGKYERDYRMPMKAKVEGVAKDEKNIKNIV